MRLVITVRVGDEAPVSHHLDQAEICLGAGPDVDVHVPAVGLSGVHARLLTSGPSVTLVPGPVPPGPRLNGAPVQGPTPVEVGDEISLGEARLRVAPDTSARAAPPPTAPAWASRRNRSAPPAAVPPPPSGPPTVEWSLVPQRAEGGVTFGRLWRAHAPGGWLVRQEGGQGLIFLPDPSHLW